MKSWRWIGAGACLLVGAGVGARDGLGGSLALTLLAGCGAAALFYGAVQLTYYRAGSSWPQITDRPLPLRLGWRDYVKALVCWFDAFNRTYAVEPGLYYTGTRYDPDSPILVTANYHLTVFLVARRVRATNARLLIVDTDGINVWCAAGKGVFSAARILEQLQRYDPELIAGGLRPTLILPKFAMAGVELKALRKARTRPVVGPLYARDLPEYLAQPPFRDRDEDRVEFGLQSRAFTWLPGLLQFLGYSLTLALALLVVQELWGLTAPLGLVGIVALTATAYPLLFPWIPGRRFAVKGIWLGTTISAGLIAAVLIRDSAPVALSMSIPFTLATGIFVALSYTGNSAVSNYSRVRREIARFLPANVLLYAASLAAFIVTGLYR